MVLGKLKICLIFQKNIKNFYRIEYYDFLDQKKRFESAIIGKEKLRDNIKRTPKRMGNSEARLHKMGGQKAKKNLGNNIKALKSRINHLEVKEKQKI
jgi:macrolide transport system ATP-binding/permease protein